MASPLADEADLVLPQAAGEERSVAATKSFVCSLMAIDLLGEALSGGQDDAEERCASVAAAAASAMTGGLDLSRLDGHDHAYVIGRGASQPVAQEAALKLKEIAGIHAEAISAAEVMHGPRAIAGRSLPVIGFIGPGEAGRSVGDALTALAGQGSPTISVTCDITDRVATAAPVALIAAFYAVLPALARRRGLDPDNPRSLAKVTLTR